MQRARIEQRDDRHRADIVDDRDGGQKQFERGGHAFPDQRQHTQCERNVGRRRDGPAARQPRIGRRDQQIDERRDDHARQRRHARQDAIVPGRQASIDAFPLDLQPDEQEEYRHQRIVDPMQHAERPDLGRQSGEINRAERRVGDDQRQCCRRHQDNATCGLGLKKAAKGRVCHGLTMPNLAQSGKKCLAQSWAIRAGRMVLASRQHQLDLTSANTSSPRLMSVL